ncbi:hypothetical protein CDFC105_93917 [Clostridioides difficile]|nr:hypothetical protein CDFC105_93917 [Clostridioides difficile]
MRKRVRYRGRGVGRGEVEGRDIGGFFFQAEDGIRDFCLSRGLGDVYKRQILYKVYYKDDPRYEYQYFYSDNYYALYVLSLIHI